MDFINQCETFLHEINWMCCRQNFSLRLSPFWRLIWVFRNEFMLFLFRLTIIPSSDAKVTTNGCRIINVRKEYIILSFRHIYQIPESIDSTQNSEQSRTWTRKLPISLLIHFAPRLTYICWCSQNCYSKIIYILVLSKI